MNIKKILVLVLFSIAIVGIITPINATDTQNIDKTVLSKEKATKYKITWNANGGKIGTKKAVTTSVTKGSKIGKVTTPKRSSYSFTGWYTAKTGGKKVTSTTKMPARNLNLYAHWKKASSNKNVDSALFGHWEYRFVTGFGYTESYSYFFYRDGKASFYETGKNMIGQMEGKITTSNGKIYITNFYYIDAVGKKSPVKNKVVEYAIGKDNNGKYLNIGNIFGTADYSEKRPMKLRLKN